MSSMTPCTVTCPHCGKEQEFEVWQSLNVTLDPDVKARFLRGEINVFACDACGERSLCDGPLLYHDMERKFSAQYIPWEKASDPAFLKGFTSEGTLPVREDDPFAGLPEMQYLHRPHVVFDMSELLRYVVFRDGLAAGA